MAIDPQRREALQRTAESQITAASELASSAVNLWKAELEVALALDDENAIRQVITGRMESNLWDRNTNCGSGCGGPGPTFW